MRWGVRLIGLVSTVILARLLVPEDFGLVAMATLFVGLVEVLGETGQQAALIRHPNPTRAHFDTAWTTQFLVSLVLGTLVLVTAPLAGAYFGDKRIVPIIQILSIRVYLIGFENIGTIVFRKELDFAKEFRYGIYRKLLTFVVTVTAAFVLRDHWALVIGIVLGEILSVVLSYLLQPYRPRLSFAAFEEIWHFSFWSWVMTVGAFIYNRVDQYVIGAFGSPTLMGLYQLAVEVGRMPSDELIRPLQRALFPTYSKLNHDPSELRDAYLNVLSVITIFAASTSTGIAFVADELVLLLLGPRWIDATPYVFWLTFAAGITAYSHSVFLILSTMGHIRRSAIQAWWRLIVMVPALLIAARIFGAEAVAITYLVGVTLLAPTYFMLLKPVLPFSYSSVVSLTWRPVVAAAVMAVVLRSVPIAWAGDDVLIKLAFKVVVGAVAFASTLLVVWILSGRPGGAESAALRFVTTRFAELRSRLNARQA